LDVARRKAASTRSPGGHRALTNGADEDERDADDERRSDERADRMKPNLAVRLAVHGGPPLPSGNHNGDREESSGPAVISFVIQFGRLIGYTRTKQFPETAFLPQ
jgi:hypothetical protein